MLPHLGYLYIPFPLPSPVPSQPRISPATPMRCEKFHESPPGGSLEGKGAFQQDTFSPPLPDTHPQRKRTISGRDDSDCWWSFRGGGRGLVVGCSRACVSYSCQVFNVKTRHRDQPTQTDEKKLWGLVVSFFSSCT